SDVAPPPTKAGLTFSGTSIRALSNLPHCSFCHSLTHVRKNCLLAGKCWHCGKHGHMRSQCASYKEAKLRAQAIKENEQSKNKSDTEEEDDFLPASAHNNARKFYKQQQTSESQAPSQGNNMPILPKNVIKAKRALVEYSKSSDPEPSSKRTHNEMEDDSTPEESNASSGSNKFNHSADTERFKASFDENESGNPTQEDSPFFVCTCEQCMGSFRADQMRGEVCETCSQVSHNLWLIQEIRILNDKDFKLLKKRLSNHKLELHMHNWNDLTCIVFKNIGQNKKISLLAPEHIINFTTLENRITSSVIHLRDSSREILLLSVYLHSGNYKNQLALLRKLSDQLSQFNNENPDIHFLIGGDFNNVLDQDLDVIRPDILIRPRLTAQEKDIMDYFEAFIAEHNLADVKTHLYPNTTEPTNNMNTKRRLDRFYLSNDLIWSLLDYRIPEDHTIGSTHFAIVMKMKICISPKLKIGDPRFCIPNKLLADDNVLQCLNQYRPRFLDNIFLSWEDNLDYLTAEIQQLKQLIHRLQRIRQAETQHVIPKTDEDQERLLKYRFRGPREVNIIENMERTDGTPVINTPEMLNVATSFYKELYQQYHVPLDPLSEFINTFPHKLTSSEKTSLEKPFTEDELYDHLVIISKSTSTGTDGISYYSLIRLWPR
ncbi:uncharacterized protein J8A68_002052, partial [[Candida] subhashii]